MKPHRTWIVIADSGRGRVLEHIDGGRGAHPVAGLAFEADLPPTHDIVTDRRSRAFEKGNPTRHAIEPKTDPREQLKRQHLAALADALDARLAAGAFDRLVLVAPPHALGVLRDCLTDKLRSAVKGELAKDLTRTPDHELAGHLEPVIRI
jgi:protein required for attachment to host cells